MNAKTYDNEVEAQTLAKNNEHWDVLYEFSRANMTFPSELNMVKVTGKFKKFCEVSNELHEAINAKDVAKVKDMLKRFKNLRYFYSLNNESAVKAAISIGSLVIFDALLSKKYRFGPHEDPAESYEELSEADRRTVRNIQNKYSQSLVDKYVHRLVENSTACFDESEIEDKRVYVERAFRLLSENLFIRIILMIVAASKNFKIFFDFNRDAVNIVDPTSNKFTQGVFYASGKIYIGAKQLLDITTEHETLAVVAHELCHFVMDIVFKNLAKPYRSDDQQTMQEFKEISEECEKNHDIEDVIDVVYDCYPDEMYHAELIVRVVHLQALYRNLPEKLSEVTSKFSRLFEFFEKKVYPELRKALPEIESRDKKELQKKDRKISKLKKISIFGVIFSVLGIIAAILVGLYFYHPNYIFDQLSIADQNKVKNASILYKGVEIQFQDIFRNDSVAYQNLTSEHISQMLNGEILNFENLHFQYLDVLVQHKWKNLTFKLREKFLSSNFTFQNFSMKIERLNYLSPEPFYLLTSQQILDVLDHKDLKISKMIRNETEFFLEREFRNENIDEIYFDFMMYLNDGYDSNTNVWCAFSNKINSTETFDEFYRNFTSQNFSTQVEKIRETQENSTYRECSAFGFQIRDVENSFLVLDTLASQKAYPLGFEDIITEMNSQKMFILSAEAGMGKTVTFEQFAIRIKRIYPLKWVSYIDFKEFKRFYNTNGTVKDVQILLENIFALDSKNEFEREIFRSLYNSGNAILIWNGFDEISPYFSDFILNVLSWIRQNTANIQFVCTRPLYSELLKTKLESKVFLLVPFNETQQEQFLTKFFNYREISDEKIPYYLEKVINIINSASTDENFYSEKPKISEDFNTPLLLLMIADLISSDVEIYETENLFEIYQKFVEKKIDIWQKNSEFAQNFTKQSITRHRKFHMMNLYQKYALINVVESNWDLNAYISYRKLKIMRQEIPKELTGDEISRMGILYINGPSSYKFAHKTFAEYFVAQYFIDNLINAEDLDSEVDGELIMDIFYVITIKDNFFHKMIAKFLYSYLQSIQKTSFLSKSILDAIKLKFQDIGFYFVNQVPMYQEFIPTLSNIDHKRLVKLLQIDENETFYTATQNYLYSSLFSGIQADLPLVKNISKEVLTEDEYKKFIHGKNQKGIILFSIYYSHAYEYSETIPSDEYEIDKELLENQDEFFVFDTIVKNLTQDEFKEMVMSSKSPIYSQIISFHTKDEFWERIGKLLSKEEQKKLLMNVVDHNFLNINFNSNMKLIFDQVSNLLSGSEIHEIFESKSIFYNLVGYASFEDTWKFFVNHTNAEQQKSILRKQSYEECSFIDSCFTHGPFNILQLSSLNFAWKFDNVLKIYENYFNNSEIRDMISSSSEFIPYLIVSVELEKCVAFIQYLKEIFKGNENALKEFLLVKVKPTKVNVFDLLSGYDSQCLKQFSDLMETFYTDKNFGRI